MTGVEGLALQLLARVKSALGATSGAASAGTANTSLVLHASRLLALNEGDMPHALRVLCHGVVETLGRVVLAGAGGPGGPAAMDASFTAHPKADPATGHLHFFRRVLICSLCAAAALRWPRAVHSLPLPPPAAP